MHGSNHDDFARRLPARPPRPRLNRRPRGFARYDEERRPYTQAVVRAARSAARLGQQLDHPVAVGLRKTAMRLTPAQAGLRAMGRLANWTPPPLPARHRHV